MGPRYNRVLRAELSMRLAHNQHIINGKKETIQCLLTQKYEKHYFDILTKVTRYFNQLTEADLNEQADLVCPESLLNLNVLKYFSDKFPNRSTPVAQLMSDDHNTQFRELIDENFDPDSFHDFNI